MDGELDEPVYRDVPPITGFIQTLPDEGSPVTETTEAWITFDREHVYVSARLWDSAPPSEWVANEMRRDAPQIRNNDTFGASFDTYYDRRNGNNFFTNPLGARVDVQHMNEGSANSDWNPIWDVRTARFEGGWSVEMQIPFKSLRYRPGRQQVWGVQLRRSIRRKNEWAHLTLIPRSAVRGNSGSTAIIRVSRHGTLVGLEAPEASRNIEIKPYGISGTRTDRTTSPPVNDDGFWDAGLDIRYGVTENLSADLTFNTDFAQVEVDEQQVNLTRFQLFFPEKRDFFLEGRGVYDFAAATFTAGASSRNTPTLFFSRRIGLDGGVVVPILAGARLTGKVGPANVGALSIQTRDEPEAEVESTNFTVLRVRQDLLRRSSLGALFASRSASTVAAGANHTFGVDGTFSFFQDLYLATYYAETRTSRSLRGRPELPGKSELQPRPMGCSAGALERRAKLQPGDRVRAPARIPRDDCLCSIQPPTGVDRGDPALLPRREFLRSAPPRAAGPGWPDRERPFPDRVREQRRHRCGHQRRSTSGSRTTSASVKAWSFPPEAIRIATCKPH